MKVSGFTFLRNANLLGYPFIESIKSALPLCDEYIVNVGESEDDTLEMVKGIGSPKIRIVRSQWNERMRTSGYVYAQQTNIALFNCTGDWAFYLQGDEAVHEDDIPKIKEAMQRHLNDDRVEALAFDYIHFYGNHKTYAWSPAWYRRETRILKNSLKTFFPSDGLFFVVLSSNKKGRYPRAALTGAKIYHYGWVRNEDQMNEKLRKVAVYWGGTHSRTDYSEIDPNVLREFKGTHPEVMKDRLHNGVDSVFRAAPDHVLTKRERKHRLVSRLEKITGLDLSKKHFKLIKT
ncbi:MAG: glycosyltransferase [Nitrospirae bacterium]|nr:glycosyltransferase [Nitrospirota bacterium]